MNFIKKIKGKIKCARQKKHDLREYKNERYCHYSVLYFKCQSCGAEMIKIINTIEGTVV